MMWKQVPCKADGAKFHRKLAAAFGAFLNQLEVELLQDGSWTAEILQASSHPVSLPDMKHTPPPQVTMF